ncbi:MAG: YjbE family putative metal transport protein [Proteobacteria bacterium]|nr:YjbE family putative metal transport protein [Pseudomonadota bacterium]
MTPVADIAVLFQVVLIDLALAADNAVAVGLAASALPAAQRRRAIFWGVLGALILRILFALVTVQLLQIKGILLFGGLLLFWVAWRMGKDLGKQEDGGAGDAPTKTTTSFAQALFTIVIADVSMSLDNVLAVAGVSRHHPGIMTFGLVLSVVLMGLAANVIAQIIQKHRWVAWVGVIVIVIAGAQMVWEDLHRFFPNEVPQLPHLGAPGLAAEH